MPLALVPIKRKKCLNTPVFLLCFVIVSLKNTVGNLETAVYVNIFSVKSK